MRIALLHQRLRVEERLLIDAFERRAIPVEPIDLRDARFNLSDPGDWANYDIVFDRCLSLTSSITAVRILESFAIRCVNPSATIEACSDKLITNLAMEGAGVPTPGARVALSPESAIETIEDLGYPCVIKPTIGSWGRLVSRVNDRDAAEAIIEHKSTLGSLHHHVHYAQEFIDKPGRDLRVFVVGGEPVAGISRSSQHWITNTARGGTTSAIDITGDVADISRRAAAAVGGDLVAIDLLECPNRGLLVNEINHSMEFRNSIDVTGVDIPGLVVDHVLSLATTRPEITTKPTTERVQS